MDLVDKYIGEANIVLQQATADKINLLAKEPTLKSLTKKIMGYQKSDPGLGLARIMTVNMMNDFILKMGSAYEAGKSFNLKSELNKKEFNKVTEPYSDWFKEYVTIVYNHLYGK